MASHYIQWKGSIRIGKLSISLLFLQISFFSLFFSNLCPEECEDWGWHIIKTKTKEWLKEVIFSLKKKKKCFRVNKKLFLVKNIYIFRIFISFCCKIQKKIKKKKKKEEERIVPLRTTNKTFRKCSMCSRSTNRSINMKDCLALCLNNNFQYLNSNNTFYMYFYNTQICISIILKTKQHWGCLVTLI